MVKLSKDKPLIHNECEINETSFGKYVEIGYGSRLNNCTIGDYSYCDRYTDIANSKIGKFSNIASFVRIGPTDHPMEKASLHHFLYRSSDYWDDSKHDDSFFIQRKSKVTEIGHDTWIGHGAIIRPQLKIGTGAVVGAGSVVTKNVKPYTIVAGVPAKPIKKRFSENIIEKLLYLSWWNWSHSKIRLALDDFRNDNIENFLDKYS